jgi:carboxyl-terminal processing protease
MKKKLILLILSIVLVLETGAKTTNTNHHSLADRLSPTEYQSQISLVVLTILEKYHYRKLAINDSLSSVIFNGYINDLDHNKVYFLKSDVENLENKYRYELDEALVTGNLEPAFEIFNLFSDRFAERNNQAMELIQMKFDYSLQESIVIDRDQREWASSEQEMQDFWRKYIKNEKLTRLLNDAEEEKVNENLTSHYENLIEWMEKLNSNDVFQLYMNSISETFDPHTNYFLPISYDNFMIGMSQSLEGIGARLMTENEYTKVAEIIPGGPAFKSKKIVKDDRIIEVAQGEEGEWVNIIGWRIDDVVQIIRGPKDTIVRLKILKGDEGLNADPVEITLVRDKIKIEEAAPTKEVMTIQRGGKDYRIGVITVPSFYLDFEAARNGDKDYKSTTKDVKNLLTELSDEDVDGLLIDLRNNGGGSLAEAIELTGLFIPEGPVVQIKNTTGKIEIQNDEDKKMFYDGPMGVIINRFSASASEIFSGAIQDYKRGIIIGDRSYGKGTVQNLLDLDRFLPENEEKPGQIKLTLAKFYRVTGSSTQHKGVTPDIILPSRYEADEFGESSMPSALPWDLISSTKFKPLNFIDHDLLLNLEKNAENRKGNETYLIQYKNDVEDWKKMKEKSEFSLNFETRKKEKEEAEKIRADRERLYGTLGQESELDEVDPEESETMDPYMQESLNVIADWLAFRIG